MATIKETSKIKGEHLLNKVKELIEEGNARKITIHDKEGKELMNFPLTLGVVLSLPLCLRPSVRWPQ